MRKLGQTNTRKEDKLAGTSTEDAIRKSFRASFILSRILGSVNNNNNNNNDGFWIA
jgi:hypothetical protein